MTAAPTRVWKPAWIVGAGLVVWIALVNVVGWWKSGETRLPDPELVTRRTTPAAAHRLPRRRA